MAISFAYSSTNRLPNFQNEKRITNLITKCKVWTSKLVKQIQLQKKKKTTIIEEKKTSRI